MGPIHKHIGLYNKKPPFLPVKINLFKTEESNKKIVQKHKGKTTSSDAEIMVTIFKVLESGCKR
jgi:hypothetical protein